MTRGLTRRSGIIRAVRSGVGPMPAALPLDAGTGPHAEATDERAFVRDPAFEANGAFCLRIDGRNLPILLGNEPVARFVPGWRATALYTGFAPLLLLEFESNTGARGLWFLDHNLNRIAGEVSELPLAMLRLLKLQAAPVLRRLVSQLLDCCEPALDPSLQDFMQVDATTRAAIAETCHDELLPEPTVDRLDYLNRPSVPFRGQDGRLRSIDCSRVMTSFGRPWQDRQASCLAAGRLSWPSPVDGADVVADGSLPLDDFHILYRFSDRTHRLVFFVVVADHDAEAVGIWFPCMNLILSRDDHHRVIVAQHIYPRLAGLIHHLVRCAGQVVPYLAAGATRFASVMRAYPSVHLGHQLWNELSGIDRAVCDNRGALPEWLVLGSEHESELYGPIDQLYPELTGRVNRSLRDIDDMLRWAYANGVLILRVTRSMVSAGLRGRIQSRVATMPAAAEVARALASGARPGQVPPVILVGLRVENRTLADLPGFLHRLAARVASRYPGATLVIDGHNARSETEDGRVIESHGEQPAGLRPIDAEHRLVTGLRMAMAGSAISIADTIGRPLSVSIAWGMACDGFVSIWGASLAKYRWACNKPGFVISSHLNLTQRPDLHIYDAPRYMEDPTPLVLADPALVTDDPQAPQLLPHGVTQPSFYNFHVDLDAMLSRIERFIADVAPG